MRVRCRMLAACHPHRATNIHDARGHMSDACTCGMRHCALPLQYPVAACFSHIRCYGATWCQIGRHQEMASELLEEQRVVRQQVQAARDQAEAARTEHQQLKQQLEQGGRLRLRLGLEMMLEGCKGARGWWCVHKWGR